MEQSPLTHQPRPEVFKPKIVQLYDELFTDDDAPLPSPGFWTAFFLLRPDRAALRQRLDALSPTALVPVEAQTRALFAEAIATAARGIDDPQVRSATAAAAALDTLTIFLSAVLAKKYTNPSADVMAVLAGLDHVDAAMGAFVAMIDGLLRHGPSALRAKGLDVALATAAGAYQTTLLTYFLHRDLFPAIMRVVLDADTPRIRDAFVLLGLLANYNKFEFRNPYQLRLADFVNEAAIQTILCSVSDGCRRLRNDYIAVADDVPEGWTLANTLGLLGLGAMAPGPKPPPKPLYDAETAARLYTTLPGGEAAVLLATYDFAHANKLFCHHLVMGTDRDSKDSKDSKDETAEPPMASFLSLASYLLQHAFCAPRTTLYAHVCLMVLRLLVEDTVLCTRLCSDDSRLAVRLCRQRVPHLPRVTQPRPLAASLLDAMVDGLTHNLQRRLDVGFYTSCVGILLRLVAHLARTRTRLAYHWAVLFRALLSLVRFLTTYAADLQDQPHVATLVDNVVNLVALGLSAGEAFLPTPAAYDDLFYKVVEAGELLVRFRDTYGLAARPASGIATLVGVSTHYQQLLAAGVVRRGGKGGRVQATGGAAPALTSLQVAQTIKQGYETLSIEATAGLDSWEAYREADERTLLKKVARLAVADVKAVVDEREGVVEV